PLGGWVVPFCQQDGVNATCAQKPVLSQKGPDAELDCTLGECDNHDFLLVHAYLKCGNVQVKKTGHDNPILWGLESKKDHPGVFHCNIVAPGGFCQKW
ncbi:MAG: hypothetical protein LC620_07880, partial [Halobacteriales archaeon]|nr:hypothetical protein [Halobacteriales archaeon]